jgi:subfamily B ATP-binding cassette protein MsbA
MVQLRSPLRAQAARPTRTIAWQLVRPRRGLIAAGFVAVLVHRLSQLVMPFTMRYLFDGVLGGPHADWLLPIVAVVSAATLAQAGSAYLLNALVARQACEIVADLRLRVQAHVARLPLAFHDAAGTGALVSRIVHDVDAVRNLLNGGLIDFAGSILTAVISLLVLLYLNMPITLVVIALLTAFSYQLWRSLQRLRPAYALQGQQLARVSGRLTESLGGVRVVKAYGAEEAEARTFAAGVHRLLDTTCGMLREHSWMTVSSALLFGAATVAVVYIGAHAVAAGTMTLGSLVAYTMFLGLLGAPVNQAIAVGSQLSEAAAALERSYELLREPREDTEPPRQHRAPRLDGEVRFDHVSFAYEPGRPVLHDLSFVAAPGSVTGLVGPSGAGKSTIVSLMAAFYTQTAGVVRVDGLDLRTLQLDGYRRQLGLVLQETFLFDGTIRANVAFAKPGASDAEIHDACRLAHVCEFAEQLELGYDTLVGERGTKLSGGQRQRIAIARAILVNPRILLLDEPTSSLDATSERLVRDALVHLMRGRTTFVISHRRSTLQIADQLLVLDRGRLVEQGTHDVLSRRHGRYAELYAQRHALASNLFLDTEVDACGPARG